MILYPNAKINLGLNILRKLPDGFHDIETLFYPIPWFDVLEIEPSDDTQVHFAVSGLEIPGVHGSNLCIKAVELLRDNGFSVPGVRIKLEKRLPAGSGLGGGSSDGAFTLRILNDLFHLGLDTGQLTSLAARLGSTYLGTIVKGNGEGVRIMPPEMTRVSPATFCIIWQIKRRGEPPVRPLLGETIAIRCCCRYN